MNRQLVQHCLKCLCLNDREKRLKRSSHKKPSAFSSRFFVFKKFKNLKMVVKNDWLSRTQRIFSFVETRPWTRQLTLVEAILFINSNCSFSMLQASVHVRRLKDTAAYFLSRTTVADIIDVPKIAADRRGAISHRTKNIGDTAEGDKNVRMHLYYNHYNFELFTRSLFS